MATITTVDRLHDYVLVEGGVYQVVDTYYDPINDTIMYTLMHSGTGELFYMSKEELVNASEY